MLCRYISSLVQQESYVGADFEALVRERTSLRQQVGQLSAAEQAAAHGEAEAAARLRAQNATAAAEAARLRTENDALKAEVAKLRAKDAAEVGFLATATTKRQAAAIANLGRDLAASQQKLGAVLQRSNTEAELEAHQLRTARDEARQATEEVGRRERQWALRVARLQTEVRQARQASQAVEETARGWQKKALGVQEELRAALDAQAKLRNNMDGLMAQAQALQDENARLSKQCG